MQTGPFAFLKQLAHEYGDGAEGDTIQWAVDQIKELRSTVSVLQGRLSEVTADLEEAVNDRQRLDFLEAMHRRLNNHYGTDYGWKLILSHNVTRLCVGQHFGGFVGDIDLQDAQGGNARCTTAREAIDEAQRNVRLPSLTPCDQNEADEAMQTAQQDGEEA
ncbi:MAG: hypothetical protein AAGI72_06600 [Pseudomonadota bacterium]